MSFSGDVQLQAVLEASSALRGSDRARIRRLPARLVAALGGTVARWRMERGLSDEPASAGDLATMILSLDGIGEAIIEAYLRGSAKLECYVKPGDPVLGTSDHRAFRAAPAPTED